MAERELSIIAKARDTLNDTDPLNYRWSQQKLMEHLNDAQDDMCRSLPLLVDSVIIHTVPGQAKYNLPYNTVKILSAFSGGNRIPFISAEELDERDIRWEEYTSYKYTEIVVNQLSQYEIRPYPLMSDTQTNSDNLDIRLRFSTMPTKLGWNEDEQDSEEELIVSPMWDFALRQYIISMAFLDYGDESNIQRSQVAAGLYTNQMGRALKLSSKSFSKRVVTSSYQGKVNSGYTSINTGDYNG